MYEVDEVADLLGYAGLISAVDQSGGGGGFAFEVVFIMLSALK